MTVPGPTPYSSFGTEPDSTHNLVVGLVPPGSRVLELGCATGYMSDVLQQRLGCTVVGVELSPEAGALAEAFCERVIIGDIEELDLEGLLAGAQFDCIIAADVLEHLKRPDVILRRLTPLLAPGGAIVGSIPNIAHGAVRLALLDGEFRYRDTGLLDNTHIRFFTRDSVQALLASAGYVLTHLLRKRADLTRTEIPVSPEHVPAEIWNRLEGDLEATTYQFIIRAMPAGAADAIPVPTNGTARPEQPALTSMATLTDQEKILRERDAWIADLQDEIAQKDERIGELQGEIEEWRGWIAQIQADDAKKDARIADLERTDAERLAWIAQLQADGAKQAARIADLEQTDAERLAWIEQLQAESTKKAERIASLEQTDVERLAWVSQLHGEVGRLQGDVTRLQEELARREKLIAKLRRETGQVDKLLAAIRRRVARARK
jgi:2-polyprenyl-3-methyl-5-hydroxy-6-metoxy-1,4-benzoquinol methylase